MKPHLNDEERPFLQPEMPPEWWIRQCQWEEQQKKEEQEKLDQEKRVIIIDV